MSETWACSRCGAAAARLAEAPFPGRWGRAVFGQACADCWKAWQNEQTLVMNHYGLRPWVPVYRERLYSLMADYLKIAPPA